MDNQFEGFPSPTKNFFSMPNEMINIIAHIKNMAELKVIIYLIRHTWGFHEYGISKTISVDEFMHGRKRDDGSRMDQGTGLSNHSVIDGLRAAVEHGYLKCDVDTSDLARVKKSYTLKMVSRGELSSPHEDTSYSEDATRRYEDTSHLAEDTSHRSEKDTNRKTPKEIQEGTLSSPLVDDAPASIIDFEERKAITDKHKAINVKGHANASTGLTQGHDHRSIAGTDVLHSFQNRADEKGLAFGNHHHSSNSDLRSSGDGLPGSIGDGSEERRRDGLATDIRGHATPAAQAATEGQLAQQTTSMSDSGTTAVQRSEDIPTGGGASLGAAQGGKSDTKEIQRRINEHRCYALEEKVDIVRERQAIKGWCNLHTVEEYERVMLKLKSDPYWGKEENYYRIGGVTLAKETPKALAAPTPMAQVKPSNGVDHERNKRHLEELSKRFNEEGPKLKGLKLRHA